MNDQAQRLREQISYDNDLRDDAVVVSIVSGKGGVGKSNFTINFALGLEKTGNKVLIFDLDVGMGNIDILLGTQSRFHINNLLKERLSIEQVIEVGPNNIHYIAGGSGLDSFFSLTDSEKDYFFHEFHKVQKEYDYILFDMGAGATKESLSFILASDECIVIATPEPTSITDAYGMIKHIINNSSDLSINIVMNRSTSSKSGYKALRGIKNVASQFLDVDVKTLGILPDDPVVTEAVMSQTPYLLLKENAAVSRALMKVVESFLSHNLETSDDTKSMSSFLNRLKNFVTRRF